MTAEYFFGMGIVALVCALIGAVVGGPKGNAGIGFFLCLLLGPVGLVILILLPASESASAKKCPHCGGSIPEGNYSRCKHCGSSLVPQRVVTPPRMIQDPIEAWEEREKSGKKLPPLR